MLKDAGFEARDAEEDKPAVPRYNMRAVRCFVGTDWAQRAKQADVLKQARPPNPLQHTDPRTTLRHYATPGAFDGLEAARRINEKGRTKQD